jgi:hypothetical protein
MMQWDGLEFSEDEYGRKQSSHPIQHYAIELVVRYLQISTSICHLFIDFQKNLVRYMSF